MASPVLSTRDAREQLDAPAILLILVAAASLLWNLLSLALNVLGVGIGALGADKAPEVIFNLFSGAIGIAMALVLVGVNGFIIWGALQMRELRNHLASVIAASLAMVPCLFPCCCPMGLPFGIWALVVLTKPEIKAAFR